MGTATSGADGAPDAGAPSAQQVLFEAQETDGRT
jgi:hypothetical protein